MRALLALMLITLACAQTAQQVELETDIENLLQQLDQKYENIADTERQLIDRLDELVQSEKMAKLPDEKKEVKKERGQLQYALDKSMKERKGVMQQIGDVLMRVDIRQRQELVRKFGLEEKINLFPIIMKRVMAQDALSNQLSSYQGKNLDERAVYKALMEEAKATNRKMNREIFERAERHQRAEAEVMVLLEKMEHTLEEFDENIKEMQRKEMCHFQIVEREKVRVTEITLAKQSFKALKIKMKRRRREMKELEERKYKGRIEKLEEMKSFKFVNKNSTRMDQVKKLIQEYKDKTAKGKYMALEKREGKMQARFNGLMKKFSDMRKQTGDAKRKAACGAQKKFLMLSKQEAIDKLKRLEYLKRFMRKRTAAKMEDLNALDRQARQQFHKDVVQTVEIEQNLLKRAAESYKRLTPEEKINRKLAKAMVTKASQIRADKEKDQKKIVGQRLRRAERMRRRVDNNNFRVERAYRQKQDMRYGLMDTVRDTYDKALLARMKKQVTERAKDIEKTFAPTVARDVNPEYIEKKVDEQVRKTTPYNPTGVYTALKGKNYEDMIRGMINDVL